MRHKTSYKVAALAALAFALSVHGQSTAPKPAAGESSSGGQVAAGPVAVIVFSDFACPYSSDLFFTLEKLKKQYPAQVNVILKQTPLPLHPEAPLAHKAALAAGRQGKFQEMAELLYSNQTRLSSDSLLSYARQLHLDIPRFRRDLNSPEIAAQIASDLAESRGMGVDATPTLFINGKRLDGLQDEQTLTTLIATASAKPLPQVASGPLETVEPAMFAAMKAAPAASKGPADAPLTIVEFTDFQCPFCQSAVAPMEQFIDQHGREVRWILHSFPLDFHLDSELANEAALAAGEQGKFWQMHDLIFAHQSAIKLGDLRSYAQQLNLDMRTFDDALATHRFAGQIAADRALGTRAGVSGTPTFFVDGQMMTGARSLPELTQMLDAHLAAPQSAGANQIAQAAVPATGTPRTIVDARTPAPLTLTWFTDVRSPLAARQAELIRTLAAKYEGRIRVNVKVFPVATRPDSHLGSAALLAAYESGKFWPMYDALSSRRDPLDREKLLGIAESLQLDRTSFAAALDLAASAVTTDLDEAERRGVQGAPVIFLNDQRVDGLQREEFYTSLAANELAKSSAAQAVTGGAPPVTGR